MPRISPVQKKPRKPRSPSKASTPAKAGTSQMALNFSMYPDLSMAISMLQKRQAQLQGEHATLVATWVKDLEHIQKQINKLKKLEGLTSAVRRPIPKD